MHSKNKDNVVKGLKIKIEALKIYKMEIDKKNPLFHRSSSFYPWRNLVGT
jgi:hypothetical protein